MRSILSKTETLLPAACLVLLAVALAGPVLPQPGLIADLASKGLLTPLGDDTASTAYVFSTPSSPSQMLTP